MRNIRITINQTINCKRQVCSLSVSKMQENNERKTPLLQTVVQFRFGNCQRPVCSLVVSKLRKRLINVGFQMYNIRLRLKSFIV